MLIVGAPVQSGRTGKKTRSKDHVSTSPRRSPRHITQQVHGPLVPIPAAHCSFHSCRQIYHDKDPQFDDVAIFTRHWRRIRSVVELVFLSLARSPHSTASPGPTPRHLCHLFGSCSTGSAIPSLTIMPGHDVLQRRTTRCSLSARSVYSVPCVYTHVVLNSARKPAFLSEKKKTNSGRCALSEC